MRNTLAKFGWYGLLLAIGFIFVPQIALAQFSNGRISFQAYAVNPSEPSVKAANGTPLKVRRGTIVEAVIEGKVRPGFYTYPVTLKQVTVNEYNLSPAKGLDLIGKVQEFPGTDSLEKHDKDRVHKKTFTWTQNLLVTKDTEPGIVKQTIKISGQVCNESSCVPFDVPLEVIFDVTDEAPVDVSSEIRNKIDKYVPPAPVGKEPSSSSPKKQETKKDIIYGQINTSVNDYKATMEEFASPAKIINDKIIDSSTASDLWAFILGGIFWGAISLITPCVFPMIPITVSIFLKQSEKENHRPILMASVYSGTIIVVLTLAAAFMLEVFRILSVNPIMNYGLGALFVFFSLSLFGMYDIELPSGLARFTSAHESKGGIIGTMFMALTFTIISFACVAPFLGGFGGTAAVTQRPMWVNLLGGLAFSATFAAPFFFLALFPTLLRKLPKSGSWLNTVKVVMGFLELAAAVKFCRSAELVATGGEPWLITFDFGMGIYIALSFMAGLYLLGVFRLPHDSPEEHLSVPRMAFAGIFIALGLYLAPSLMKNSDGDNIRPRGTIYSWVEAFLLPDAYDSPNDEVHTPSLAAAVKKSMDQYQVDLAKAKDLSKDEKGKVEEVRPRRIFVDFTGLNCTNCRINEKSVFSKRYVREIMDKYLIVKLYADAVPFQYFAPEVRANLTVDRQKAYARANLEFEKKIFNNEQLPLYAILEPQADGKIKVLAAYDEGRINNETAFTEFLTDPK